jgi:ribosomal protein S18 acetylase RimI-like enzyme
MRTPGIKVRPAESADARAIARVFLQSAEHHARLDPDRYYVPEMSMIESRYRKGRQHPPGAAHTVTLVAEIGKEVVGFADARLDRSLDAMHRAIVYCYISEIAVSTVHRSQGIGESLMKAVEAWGRMNSAEFAMLEYLPGNSRAASFYHDRLGYRVASILVTKRLD